MFPREPTESEHDDDTREDAAPNIGIYIKRSAKRVPRGKTMWRKPASGTRNASAAKAAPMANVVSTRISARPTESEHDDDTREDANVGCKRDLIERVVGGKRLRPKGELTSASTFCRMKNKASQWASPAADDPETSSRSGTSRRPESVGGSRRYSGIFGGRYVLRMAGLVGAMVSFEEGHELLHELAGVNVPTNAVPDVQVAVGIVRIQILGCSVLEASGGTLVVIVGFEVRQRVERLELKNRRRNAAGRGR